MSETDRPFSIKEVLKMLPEGQRNELKEALKKVANRRAVAAALEPGLLANEPTGLPPDVAAEEALNTKMELDEL